MKIDSGYKYNKSDTSFMYELTETGYNIYIGDSPVPTYAQYEPFIPDPSKSYEENAILDCKKYSKESELVNAPAETLDDRLTNIESNIDYLMLLNDPDSASETVTE